MTARGAPFGVAKLLPSFAWHVDIDVEVNFLDTDLLLAVPAAFMPAALAHLRIFDLRKLEKFPVATGRKPRLL